ncbi:hypothetical protein PVL29_016729 [Vitis rotundifolia]|uniref:Uncharacterized protein n=1 Tax=Vitis rotundifolia TaxID=103349 RepID=A0AA38Z8L9_VITRO|nr:hypothetical protein PVL29_016729 [Vitis rotundifolia]
MDVPEIMLYLATLLSPGTSVKGEASQDVGTGKEKVFPSLPSSGIIVPAAPAASTACPRLDPSQNTIFPVTRDLSKESSVQSLHFMINFWAFSDFKYHKILNFLI